MPLETTDGSRIDIAEADLGNDDHCQAVLALIDAYAKDPMGDGRPLADRVRSELIPGLRAHPTTIIFLAFEGDRAVGIAVCFRGFSTFAARPLINIHDLAVLPEMRGRGIGPRLLSAVLKEAQRIGSCKITLEVQENNHRARRVYTAAGFEQASYEKHAGGVLFLSKPVVARSE